MLEGHLADQGLEELRTTADRRVSRPFFRARERRTGFDRRKPDRILGTLSQNTVLLFSMLVVLNVLSAADWLLTLRALDSGAAEANLAIGGLLAVDPLLAGAFKAGIMIAVSIVIWKGSRYRLIVATGLAAFVGYCLLMVYHVGGLAAIGAL
jgi:hypothetical protein